MISADNASAGSIAASAPGKIVLWGEYAVLAGAPAAVLAVDRRAVCTITPSDDFYTFTTSGFVSEPQSFLSWRDAQDGGAAIAYHALNAMKLDNVAPFNMHIDSAPFYRDGNKLGIGSSAASTVATCSALAEWCQQEFSHAGAHKAHRSMQGGSGSGLDVEAALQGGTLKFCGGKGKHFTLPKGVIVRAVFTGQSAPTGKSLQSFAEWREQGGNKVLDTLGRASEALFEDTGSEEHWLTYVQALKNLDESAKINIYTPAHQKLAKLADDHGLIYKPCGAGGGDVGIIVVIGRQKLASATKFLDAATRKGYFPLDLNESADGVRFEN